MKKILMLAGEPSGDLHGSNLAIELKKITPEIELLGTGGEKMKAAGVKVLFDLKDLAVTGLIDVVRKYFHFKKIQKSLLSFVMDSRLRGNDTYFSTVMPAKAGIQKPNLIILIDYPDFNLRFAKLAHRFGVPIIYYISPQVWAWRKGRIKLIKKYIKKIYCIFKFEEEIYKEAGVDVEFIGHPLLDIARPSIQHPASSIQYPVSSGKTIALLPGSRKRLIKTLLPIMLKAAEIIHRKFPQTKFIISKIPSVDKKIYEDALAKHVIARSFDAVGATKQSLFTIIEGDTYDLINAADLVLTVSGTSTLETAILEKPMIIIYKLPLLEYILAKPLLRLKNIGLVNIVAGEEIVPECVQFKTRPKKIAGIACDILTDKNKYDSIKSKLSDVKSCLYPAGAAKKAAVSILETIYKK